MTFCTLLLWAIIPPGAGTLHLDVVGADGQPLPCRVHLVGPDGKSVRAEGLPFWHDHFVCPGQVMLAVPPGRYAYSIERGPEHERIAGTIDVAADTPATSGAWDRRPVRRPRSPPHCRGSPIWPPKAGLAAICTSIARPPTCRC